MRKYLVLFSFSGESMGHFVGNPSDRAAVVGKLAAGIGGSDGQGVGGGIYIVASGTVCVDLVTNITHNHASTSDDDVFGVLCFI